MPIQDAENRQMEYTEADSIKEFGVYTEFRRRQMPTRVAVVRAGIRGPCRLQNKQERERVAHLAIRLNAWQNKTGARRLVAIMCERDFLVTPDVWTLTHGKDIKAAKVGKFDGLIKA